MSIDRELPFYLSDLTKENFSADAIEAQGRVLVYRALNIGRAIGFIGSGVSCAYGRPTWSALVRQVGWDLRRKMRELSDAGNAKAKDALGKLEQELKAFSAPGNVADPDRLPRLAHTYRVLCKKAGLDEAFVEARIKDITRDDDWTTRSAWRLFDEGYEPSVVEAGDSLADPINQKQRKALDDEILKARSRDCLEYLVTILEPIADRSFVSLRQNLRDRAQHLGKEAFVSSEEPAMRLSVEERFLLPLIYAAAACEGQLESVHALSVPSVAAEPDARRCTTLDPVLLITEDLGVRRILTTNYDFELERGLERVGFARGLLRPLENWSKRPPFRAERVLGERARTLVFRKETAADLTDFAVHAQGFEYDIFHLHGWSAPDPNDHLVITEPDYQRVYMRDEPEAHVMDEALSVAMSGSPIIFIGMGMREADLLRPLRRFVATHQSNRSIFALLPAEEGEEQRSAFAKQLFLSYGVHALFYGESGGAAAYILDQRAASEIVEVDPWVRAGGRSKQVATLPGDERPLFRRLEKLRALRKAISSGAPQLSAWVSGSGKEVQEYFEDFVRAGGSGEVIYVSAIHGLVSVLRSDVALKRSDVRSALIAFLDELEGRVRARALTVALRDLKERRLQWWREWQEPPRVRTYVQNVEEWTGGGSVQGEAARRSWRLNNKRGRGALLERGASARLPIRCVRFECVSEHVEDENVSRMVNRILMPQMQEEAGRRVVVVYGESGVGRGSLFHALADRMARPEGATYLKESPFDWGLFTNATFTTEYSSVIDGVIDFLKRCNLSDAQQQAELLRRWSSGAREVMPTRREAVRVHLQEAITRTKQDCKGRRGLFVVGGAELLFRKGGAPKNVEIVEALSVFFEDKMAAAPMDIVFICAREHCEGIFGSAFVTRTDNVRCGGATFGTYSGDEEAPPVFDVTFLPLTISSITSRIEAAVEQTSFTHTEAKGDQPQSFTALRRDLLQRLKGEPSTWQDVLSGRFRTSIVIFCAFEVYHRVTGVPWNSGAHPLVSTNDHDRGMKAIVGFLRVIGDERSRRQGLRRAISPSPPCLDNTADFSAITRNELAWSSARRCSSICPLFRRRPRR